MRLLWPYNQTLLIPLHFSASPLKAERKIWLRERATQTSLAHKPEDNIYSFRAQLPNDLCAHGAHAHYVHARACPHNGELCVCPTRQHRRAATARSTPHSAAHSVESKDIFLVTIKKIIQQ
ncbi:hypothetical protein EVAR_49997_1 [Eumeta japonica]|uniref:Uncharacterized protein n=1 Tax=Eumeta variegata TaxID=151549 RepID=A0A4C1XPV7_EUMVA|nr:hypothetical protein EVAR_49997_1 [Eumeta japonica]